MFFTYTSRIVAILAFAFGVLQILLGLSIASGHVGPYEAALARYAPNATSSGEVIDNGFDKILFALALGTLTEIGLAARRGRGKE